MPDSSAETGCRSSLPGPAESMTCTNSTTIFAATLPPPAVLDVERHPTVNALIADSAISLCHMAELSGDAGRTAVVETSKDIVGQQFSDWDIRSIAEPGLKRLATPRAGEVSMKVSIRQGLSARMVFADRPPSANPEPDLWAQEAQISDLCSARHPSARPPLRKPQFVGPAHKITVIWLTLTRRAIRFRVCVKL